MDGWTYDFDEDLRGLGEVIERHLHPEFTFVNIGANDGVNSDPVWPFATKHGWRGVCVEPAPAVFELLQANYSPYPRVQTVRAAISSEPRTFWFVEGADYVSNQIGSLDRERVERSFESVTLVPDIGVHVPSERPPTVPIDTIRRDGEVTSTEVECLTFDQLAQRCDLDRVDLVNIDVEGTDWEVLAMIDLDRYRTSVVIVETAGTPDEAAIRAHLDRCGFALRRSYGVFSTVWERLPDA